MFALWAATGQAGGQPKPGSVRVEGNEFILLDGKQGELRGTQLKGRTLTLANGFVVRINAVTRDARAPDLFLYDLQVPDGAAGKWRPMCEPDAEGQRLGFGLAGRTSPDGEFVPDPGAVRLTCTSGALAKCIRYGFRYWDARGARPDLTTTYQACVRMIRADYCGDGVPATRAGMVVDIWDVARIKHAPPSTGRSFEAGWTPKGAVCVHHTRVADIEQLPQLLRRCPRLAAESGPHCTEERARALGAVLFNASGAER
jgi:hypothetical protein